MWFPELRESCLNLLEKEEVQGKGKKKHPPGKPEPAQDRYCSQTILLAPFVNNGTTEIPLHQREVTKTVNLLQFLVTESEGGRV